MPYKVMGNKVMHFKNGKWSLKQMASSHENALKAMRLLQGIDSGSIKKSQRGRKNYLRG